MQLRPADRARQRRTAALTGDEGGRATFYFGALCGASVYYLAQAAPEWIAIPVGAFADPGFPAPQVSVYESRMHAWVLPPAAAGHIL